MHRLDNHYALPDDLAIGRQLNRNVPEGDQVRQRDEIAEILARLRSQPGVILADEVGMGKTYVALGVAYNVAVRNPTGPVIVMVPANLIDKWQQDLKTFCELYVPGRQPVQVDCAEQVRAGTANVLRYGVARDSVALLKLLDDPPRSRAQVIFLAQSAMARRQGDRWIRLALIAEALRTHGRGKARRLIQVKAQIHRFLAELLWAIGEERRHDWGDELWQRLLRSDPENWKEIYNRGALPDRQLSDDPVPKAVVRALQRMNLRPLAEALEQMPIRAVGGDKRVSERLTAARRALKEVERDLWGELLTRAHWRSPLLVMDEAHHLKNPDTSLARQLQSPDSDETMRTGDGAMSQAFDRMLFLTATPFQLGHHELVRVLERFGDVRWNDGDLGDRGRFSEQMATLSASLDDSQRGAIALQRAWSKLKPEDCEADVDTWWRHAIAARAEDLPPRQRAVVETFHTAKRTRDTAEEALRSWVVRHNKGRCWDGTVVGRRARFDGGSIADILGGGLPIPPPQLLPFFLAARSAISAGTDVLGEALSSSYEAFRHTRAHRQVERDQLDREGEPEGESADLTHSKWYLAEFDRALDGTHGGTHPKVAATVRRAVDLWERGEKVLVFAFYRRTCRALRIHISDEISRRMAARLRRGEQETAWDPESDPALTTIQKRFFDDSRARGRRALDAALEDILASQEGVGAHVLPSPEERDELVTVMRRFLRAPTTLARVFPIDEVDSVGVDDAVQRMLDNTDGSNSSWRDKFRAFIEFLFKRSSASDRRLFLEAARRAHTGGIRVEDEDDEDAKITVANVQLAMGTTRRDARQRLMRAFNTPFFPDILVCSEVMGEGVDLHRFCRHVIHHDLAWNPSTIEQRTGRVDRLGCKAEGRQAIEVFLPYLAGTADERMYQVMCHREQWFRVVMGQEEVSRLITPESDGILRLPVALADQLSFNLGLK